MVTLRGTLRAITLTLKAEKAWKCGLKEYNSKTSMEFSVQRLWPRLLHSIPQALDGAAMCHVTAATPAQYALLYCLYSEKNKGLLTEINSITL